MSSIYIKLLVCVFVCVSRFVRHTTNIKGRGFRCYGNGTGDVGVRVVGLLPSNSQSTPSHPISVTTDQYHDKFSEVSNFMVLFCEQSEQALCRS